MENYIYYYYSLNVTEVKKYSNYYYLIIDDCIYYFCYTLKKEDDLSNLLSKLDNRNYHLIIKNKFNKIISIYEEHNYVLLKINCILNDFININEIISNRSNIKEIVFNWGNVWSNRIDYMENQLSELGLGKEILINSFSYYNGLAENAISYYNYNNVKSDNISLCHNRIYYPNKAINYWNPLVLIIDYDVRDYAEYLKSSFFNNDDKIDSKVSLIVNNEKYGYSDMILLVSRLLYPSYYFDLFEELIDSKDEETEKKLTSVISKQNDYELFLHDIIYEIKAKYNIPEIKWLKKSNKLES